MDGPTIYAWLSSVIGMTLLFAAAYGPDCGPVSLIKGFSLLFFRSVGCFQEAVFGTLALGMFSLWFLLKRSRNQVGTHDESFCSCINSCIMVVF